jgi:TatD DNase family protein
VIAKMPLDRILLETDCPYLTPPPLSGRNEPKNAMIIAQRVAQIRNELPEALIATANQNARELFRV